MRLSEVAVSLSLDIRKMYQALSQEPEEAPTQGDYTWISPELTHSARIPARRDSALPRQRAPATPSQTQTRIPGRQTVMTAHVDELPFWSQLFATQLG